MNPSTAGLKKTVHRSRPGGLSLSTGYRVAQRIGWKMLPWPLDYRTGNPRAFGLQFLDNLDYLERAVHEWIGLTAYGFPGGSAALFDRC